MKEGMIMDKKTYRKTDYNKPFIVQRADPYVYRHEDGTYWFTASVPEYDRIILRKSATLDGLSSADEITIWKKHESGVMSIHIWAPELHYIDGKWFIYYAGGDKDDVWAIRPYVLMCEGSDPLKDPWKEMGMLEAVEEFGMNVERAVDGKNAVEIFRNHPEGTFDVILMDIMMPEMNGYEAAKAIRAMNDRPDGKNIPIIAMTANSFAEDVQASLDAGMNAHLSKPIVIDEVIKTIIRYVYN